MCAEREMGSREKDQTAPHQPLLSSLVVRPTDNGGGGGGTGSDYEPGEVRHDPPPYSRPNRYDGDADIECVQVLFLLCIVGIHIIALVMVLNSPVVHHEIEDLAMGKNLVDIVITLPLIAVGEMVGGFLVEVIMNSMHVCPGLDYSELRAYLGIILMCSQEKEIGFAQIPLCKNLNFARRDHCNNCRKPRYGSSPRRGYPGPPFPPRHRVPPIPLPHSPGRSIMNGGYNRSPPRAWPRDFRAAAGPPARREARFTDLPLAMHGDRQDFPDDDHPIRDRYRYNNRPHVLPEWNHRERDGTDNYLNNERRGFGRRVLSPPAPRGYRTRDRSRSPIRGGDVGEPKEYQYMNRR
ncbi:hypothetical protein CASFOL_032639 [Castilleja foliolosa]|uniref:Uncharacterized protein n=1 Tax=Castilleja foliolosa TaxID=1961234 RepID=A0ABD3C2Y2_9LAMI